MLLAAGVAAWQRRWPSLGQETKTRANSASQAHGRYRKVFCKVPRTRKQQSGPEKGPLGLGEQPGGARRSSQNPKAGVGASVRTQGSAGYTERFYQTLLTVQQSPRRDCISSEQRGLRKAEGFLEEEVWAEPGGLCQAEGARMGASRSSGA